MEYHCEKFRKSGIGRRIWWERVQLRDCSSSRKSIEKEAFDIGASFIAGPHEAEPRFFRRGPLSPFSFWRQRPIVNISTSTIRSVCILFFNFPTQSLKKFDCPSILHINTISRTHTHLHTNLKSNLPAHRPTAPTFFLRAHSFPSNNSARAVTSQPTHDVGHRRH